MHVCIMARVKACVCRSMLLAIGVFVSVFCALYSSYILCMYVNVYIVGVCGGGGGGGIYKLVIFYKVTVLDSQPLTP